MTTYFDHCLHPNYFGERSYCRYIPPLGSLLLESSSAVATTTLMDTNLVSTPYLYPLFLPLEAHLLKFVKDYYMTAPR